MLCLLFQERKISPQLTLKKSSEMLKLKLRMLISTDYLKQLKENLFTNSLLMVLNKLVLQVLLHLQHLLVKLLKLPRPNKNPKRKIRKLQRKRNKPHHLLNKKMISWLEVSLIDSKSFIQIFQAICNYQNLYQQLFIFLQLQINFKKQNTQKFQNKQSKHHNRYITKYSIIILFQLIENYLINLNGLLQCNTNLRSKMQNLINLNTLTDHLIRPPKFTYSLTDLGPSIFEINNIIHQRIDSSVMSQHDKKLQVSVWKRKDTRHNQNKIKNDGPVLIYLHCNCGSRVQAIQHVNRSLQLGYTFVAYDSRACGHSQGQYISLGYHQILDLEAIIKYICSNLVLNPQIVLWGRSMGAVTALNYLSKNKKFINNIKIAVLDSPFISLQEVICEIVNKKVGAPKMLVNMFLSYLEPLIQQKAGFKISQFNLRNQILHIKCPLILMASKSDGLVPFHHLQQIYEAHKGKKSIFYLNQSHTDQRSSETISKIFKAINRYFLSEKKNNEIPSFAINQQMNGFTQLSSFRSSQLPSAKSETASKRSNRKKIILTSLNTEGKKQHRPTNDSIQKIKKNNQNIRTTQKKQKLSLNHCKSNLKIQPKRTIIKLFKTQHKSTQSFINQNAKKYQEDSQCQQIFSQFDPKTKNKENKQNITRKRVSQFIKGQNLQKMFTFKTNI